MDPRSAAGLLGRTLIRLGAAKVTGVLEVKGTRGAAIGLRRGQVYALRWPEAELILGEVLQIDAASHARALARSLPSGAVGEWLVSEGLATRAALSHALRAQLRQRVALLFGWQHVELGYRPGAELDGSALPELVDGVDLALSSMRRQAARVPARQLRQVESAEWRLSRSADVALGRATLSPVESAVLAVLRLQPDGIVGRELVARLGGSLHVYRCLHGWSGIGLIAPLAEGSRAHRLLLRKRNELRRRQSARMLLDAGDGRDGRRALRQLARELHPDRFEGPLRAASTEIFQELVAAERRLR